MARRGKKRPADETCTGDSRKIEGNGKKGRPEKILKKKRGAGKCGMGPTSRPKIGARGKQAQSYPGKKQMLGEMGKTQRKRKRGIRIRGICFSEWDVDL